MVWVVGGCLGLYWLKIHLVFQLMPALDHVSPAKSSPSVSAQSENTPNTVTSRSDLMETAVDKHGGISQRRCHNAPGRGGEVSSGRFLKRSSVSEDRSSPSNSADLFPTPASSRESILSECEDRDKFWWGVGLSSVTSPVSFSRTVSPCSSVRSGVFTPSVVQVKRHFLAPGSSLVNIPQTCMSSCESLSVPQSPPPRHRPPLTRLSLLTAILRKGRLPVLSSSLQRPYTPCWPVNPVTLSFCNACSAASSVASIPLEFSSRFSSTASVDSQSHVHREPSRLKRCHLNSIPRWEEVVSPPPQRSLKPVKNNTLPQAPPPLFLSQYKSVSPPDHEEISHCTSPIKAEHSYISISKPMSPELKSSTTQMSLKGHVGNKINPPISVSPQPITEEDTCVPQKWTRLPHSSFSKLQSLSQQLRSASSCPPHIHSSQPRSPSITVIPAHTNAQSPLPPSQNATGKYKSERDRPAAKKPLSSHCLSPSRYTPIVFPGWPSPTASPSPTPSPAPPIRDLTPSPSLSLRSTPSPRPGSGISDCSDREGKKRKPHKIKSSYKSLAAIPTNTLLLDQQVSYLFEFNPTYPCCYMCSPAQLRQQSEELYAVIDEILGKTILTIGISCKTTMERPFSATSHVNKKTDVDRCYNK
uniref:Uncharacterized protein n=1 Tax=Sphaeramia orbicularis TaxID=375764 RepID=A0A673B2D4_9TELE